MNALLNAKRAYSAAKAPTRTPKDLEFEAIARITHRMISASKQGPEGFSALAEALTDNPFFAANRPNLFRYKRGTNNRCCVICI